jgi:asparagine synthetase B (glutamine-hydrolysing)
LGAIAAVFSKSPIGAPRLIRKMLCAMAHRAQDGAAVAWGNTLESAKSPGLLAASSSSQHTAVGHGFTQILPEDKPQPLQAEAGWLCLDGRVVADGMLVGAERGVQLLAPKLTPAEFPSIHLDVDGAYALCWCDDSSLLVTRDSLGLKPLFIGSRGDLFAVASDRKALWAVGISETKPFPPGGYLRASKGPLALESSRSQLEISETPRRDKVDADELLRLLVESVSIQTAGVGKVATGFSGGLDSAVVAKIAKNAGVDSLLVTLGVGRTPEMSQAEAAARIIGLPIITREFSMNDVAACLDHVLWLIEEPNLMKTSVAMAISWTAQIAAENGRSVIMLGQGSDELFGGYKKFATIMGESGADAASEAISESVGRAHEVNYQRDEQAISALRSELRLPFATRKIMEFASRVPLVMKVKSPSDNFRKWILRDAAVKLGIPTMIAMRPKKAIQHASGVEKAIRGIAKRHGLSASSYLEQRLVTIKNEPGAAGGSLQCGKLLNK